MTQRLLTLAALACMCGGCNKELANTAAPPGDLLAYRPFAHIKRLAAFAGPDAKLVSISARRVLPSGRMRLVTSSATGTVSYRFIAKDDEGRYCNVAVSVQAPHMTNVSHGGMRRGDDKKHLGMQRSPSPYNALAALSPATTVPPPRCTAADLLAKTLGKKPAAHLRASIEYNKRGYEISIKTGAKAWINTRFDSDCKLTRRN